MRILGLHVENFGGLHDHTETFEAGLNVRLRPNGWGKSTLAVFIKAMLYGLPVTTKRSLLENERKRYFPWQGGAYGGSLDIKVGGEEYRIERFFGVKEAEDSLTVLSLRTGEAADTDWAAKPGEGLFGVDAAAYERSTYLSQRPEDMTKDGAVSIHTKLNRLVDATDDLANYDSAMQALEKRRRELRHLTGGGGEIAANEERLTVLDREIERCYAQRAALENCRVRMVTAKQSIQEWNIQLKQLQDEETRQLRLREHRAIAQRLTSLQHEESELRELLERLRGELGGKVPTEEMIEDVVGAIEARDAARRSLLSVGLTEQEQDELASLQDRFPSGIPTSIQLDGLREAARDYNRAAVLAADHETGASVPAASESEQWLRECDCELGDLGAKLTEVQRKIVTLCTKQSKQNTVAARFALAVSGAVSLGLMIGSMWFFPLLIVGAVLILMTVGAGVMLTIRIKKNATDESEQAALLQAQLRELEQKIKHCHASRDAAEQGVRLFALWNECFGEGECPDVSEVALRIERLAAQSERLRVLWIKREQGEQERAKCQAALEAAEQTVRQQLLALPGAPEDDSKVVRWLTEQRRRLLDGASHYERKRSEIVALREQYNTDGEQFDAFSVEREDMDEQTLADRRREAEQNLAMWSDTLLREQQNEERLLSDTDALDELESEREMLATELEKQIGLLSAIQSAQKYLKLAREQLSGRYLNTMQKSFGQYMQALTGEDAPAFTMDSQFRVKLRATGAGRDSDAFSVGVRDLIALCERLSLLDAMFEGERPFLILDDPFTNLDDATTARAAALVRSVAKRYQVLYLTCNSSRVVDENETDVKEDENA